MRFAAGRDVVAELLLAGAPRRSKGAAARLRHGTALLWSKDAVNAQAPMRSQLSGGAAAEHERWHSARAPLRGKGAGREQELARGVRS